MVAKIVHGFCLEIIYFYYFYTGFGRVEFSVYWQTSKDIDGFQRFDGKLSLFSSKNWSDMAASCWNVKLFVE